jgi:hypothetical protein
MPLIAAAVTLLLVGLLVWALVPYLTRQKPAPPGNAGTADEIRQHYRSAKRALGERKYEQAQQDARAARQLCDEHPGAVGRDERLQVEQLARESDLIASLLSASLQEIVGDARATQESQWPARFNRKYQGQAVVFDDQLRPDGAGRPTLRTYEVQLEAQQGDKKVMEKVHVAVEELRVLRQLPLDPPRRVLFGARLAKVGREQGKWVVRFDPDSGVLLTDREAAWGLPADDDLLQVLAWQQEWLRKRADPDR